MGCCQSELRTKPGNFVFNLKECIEKNAQKEIKKILQSLEFEQNKEKILNQVDRETWLVKQLKLNALAYSLYLGRSLIFQILHQAGCSFKATDELLKAQGLSIIKIICMKGFSDILNYYLPLYEDDGESAEEVIGENTYSAVQLAVLNGNLSIVTIVFNFFKERETVPRQLDIQGFDRSTGENCALIAVKTGNFPMVKVLHQKCAANFSNLNKHGENALKVAVIHSRIKPELDYYQIIVFLIDIIGISIKENLSDLLIISNKEEINQYLKKKAIELRIPLDQSKLDSQLTEEENHRVVIHRSDLARFNFMTMYAQDQDDRENSLASSIPANHSANSAFDSTLSVFHN